MPVPPAGAIVAARIKRDINRFVKAEAFSEKSARTTEELGVRKGFLFNRLVNQGVFIETSGHRYYLHLENLAAYQQSRRRRALIALAIILVTVLILYLFAGQTGH